MATHVAAAKRVLGEAGRWAPPPRSPAQIYISPNPANKPCQTSLTIESITAEISWGLQLNHPQFAFLHINDGRAANFAALFKGAETLEL